jgi:hypothetical protein
VLGIHKLDDCGAAQLKADLDYLINVTQALSLPRHALLDHMAALAAGVGPGLFFFFHPAAAILLSLYV